MNYYTAMKIVCNCMYQHRELSMLQMNLVRRVSCMIAFLSPQDSQNCSILFGIVLMRYNIF